MSACFCVGPQNGNPVCPCRMRNMKRRNGRWVEEHDFGPVSPPPPDFMLPSLTIGCVCPPTSEQTCQNPTCPRKPIKDDPHA